MISFAQRLREVRKEYGISQRSLALSLGLSDKTISSYETSNSYPNLEILKRIAEFFKKPTDYFLSTSSNEQVSLLKRIERLERENELLKKKLKQEG
ncbi:MAG: helix-turn-helix domain-containing protein [Candidatus Dojkabacteria bacterium]